MHLQKYVLKYIRKIRKLCGKTCTWMAKYSFTLSPSPAAGIYAGGLEKVINSMFLSLQTDKHLMKQNKCFKWLIILQVENATIAFLKKACLFHVSVCWMWEYRSRLSSKVNFVVFFTSICFSGEMRPYESLVVESFFLFLLFLFPFCITKSYYYIEWAKEGPERSSEFSY